MRDEYEQRRDTAVYGPPGPERGVAGRANRAARRSAPPYELLFGWGRPDLRLILEAFSGRKSIRRPKVCRRWCYRMAPRYFESAADSSFT